MKKIVLFLILGVFTLTGCKEKNLEQKVIQNVNQNTIFYFYTGQRCVSCKKIERYTREVYQQEYADKYDFKAINVDELENDHYRGEYNIYSKSVILVKTKNGKEVGYKNLDQIWTHLYHEKMFKSYIKDEVDAYFCGAGKCL